MLGARLNTIHNLWFFAQLMQEIRNAVRDGTFQAFRREFHRTYLVDRPGGESRVDTQTIDVS
jgi:queuine tRNA-ribosyltransferase